ncbi:phage Gp37/Gp68 family protein [Bradyrhizobium sp. RT9a]|uniref:phage Gp37/Gp68 family protein n=1 Tax=Bradyrhizobium sp. RT9a TaxID=3156384 RepID=UPI00339409CF
MSKTSIEWTQATWNPIVGCSIVSPGCTNCYAMAMAARIQKMNRTGGSNSAYVNHYDGTTKVVNGNPVWTGKLAKAPNKVWMEPLGRKKPTTYFVNSMGDLFHEDVPDEWILDALTVIAIAGQHTFQILTKRADRMREFMSRPDLLEDIYVNWYSFDGGAREVQSWPLHNLWLGVSTERQKEADERLWDLINTPAAVHFASIEPMLGPIDLTRIRAPIDPHAPDEEWLFDALGAGDIYEQRFTNSLGNVWFACGDGPYREAKLDWVIVGGESGPGSRPMHPDWARSLRDQCLAAGVPFFFKQWGNWYPIIDRDKEGWDKAPLRSDREPDKYRIHNFAGGQGFHGERVHLMQRYGKKASGRLLDGLVHDEMPAAFSGRRAITDQLEGAAP